MFFFVFLQHKNPKSIAFLLKLLLESCWCKRKGAPNFFLDFFLCFSADLNRTHSICGAQSFLPFESLHLRVSNAVFRIPLYALVFFNLRCSRMPQKRGVWDCPDWHYLLSWRNIIDFKLKKKLVILSCRKWKSWHYSQVFTGIGIAPPGPGQVPQLGLGTQSVMAKIIEKTFMLWQ